MRCSTIGWISIAVLTLTSCAQLKRISYEGLFRDEWQKPDDVIRELGIQPGMSVADVGAGGGYFTFRFSEAVGSTGKVYAVEVDKDMVIYLGRRTGAQASYKNVNVIHGGAADPVLPEDTIDVLFTCNTYHHIADRTDYFKTVKKYLKPGGAVAIIDFKPEGFFSGWLGHGTSDEQVKREMEAAGFSLVRQPDFLERQFFLIFRVSN